MLTWVILGAIIAPAATALAQPVRYQSTGSACQPLGFIIANAQTCPTRITQDGALDTLGCAGPEPATCTITDHGTATGHGAPGAPRVIRLLLIEQRAGAPPPARVCESALAGSAEIPVSCTGDATFELPLALGACTELRSHAEMSYGTGDASALMAQTELAYRLCRSTAGAVSLTRA